MAIFVVKSATANGAKKFQGTTSWVPFWGRPAKVRFVAHLYLGRIMLLSRHLSPSLFWSEMALRRRIENAGKKNSRVPETRQI